MAKVFAFLAEGMEEVECLAVVDVLRRAQIETTMVSVTGKRQVTGSHHITVEADDMFEDVNPETADLLFLPGGKKGTDHLKAHKELAAALLKANQQGRRIAAICAAPSVLGELGILKGRTATCYPGFEGKLKDASYSPMGVVTDGNITTARGMGCALDLGLELVRLLQGSQQAQKIKESIQYEK